MAIDAVAAKLMGFDPMKIRFIRLAHDAGLGCGDPTELELVGDSSAAQENWHFEGPFRKMTFASRMQHKIYWGAFKRPLEWSLKTVLAPWSYIASVIYHDLFWYPLHRRRVEEALGSEWGRLFANWESLALPPQELEAAGWASVGAVSPRHRTRTLHLIGQAVRVLGASVVRAPEFTAPHHHPRHG